MPAKDFLDNFNFDPSTFQFDAFKARLASEIAADEDLATAKITSLTESNTALDASTRDLKVKLFDATIARQGEPVTPTDSPAAASGGGPNGSAPAVPDSDIFAV